VFNCGSKDDVRETFCFSVDVTVSLPVTEGVFGILKEEVPFGFGKAPFGFLVRLSNGVVNLGVNYHREMVAS